MHTHTHNTCAPFAPRRAASSQASLTARCHRFLLLGHKVHRPQQLHRLLLPPRKHGALGHRLQHAPRHKAVQRARQALLGRNVAGQRPVPAAAAAAAVRERAGKCASARDVYKHAGWPPPRSHARVGRRLLGNLKELEEAASARARRGGGFARRSGGQTKARQARGRGETHWPPQVSKMMVTTPPIKNLASGDSPGRLRGEEDGETGRSDARRMGAQRDGAGGTRQAANRSALTLARARKRPQRYGASAAGCCPSCAWSPGSRRV
jgi:hypothetical protein